MLSNLKLPAWAATTATNSTNSNTTVNANENASANASPLTTPKAAAPISNPFDAIDTTHYSSAHSHSSSLSDAAATTTPMATTPAVSVAIPTPTAQPTTQLTISQPDFTFKSSPPPGRVKTPTVSSSPPQTSLIAAYASKSPNAALRYARGQLHVKLIEANALNVKSTNARPYVVVVYEQNEFVSREPIHEHEKEARGVPAPLSRQSSSSALAALNGIQHKFKIEPRQAQPPSSSATANNAPLSTSAGSSSRSSSGSSGGSKPAKSAPLLTAQPPPLPSTRGLLSTNLSAMNPVWKHEVSFDVTSEQSVLQLNIYDRECDGIDGYLGTVELTPALIHDHPVDAWHKLESTDHAHHVTGSLRVQITYEQAKNKRSLQPRDFEVLKLIGKGTFGRVFQVRKRDTKRIYAMKVLSKREIVAKKEVAHTIGERKILQASLECPFLVGLKFSFQTDQELFFVTDFKSGGELFWHLQRETRFSEHRARFYIAELTLALEHLHKHDIVYRDLKPENILLDATGHVALCDFGLSKPDLAANQLTNTFCGTTEYLAPEILLDDHGYSKMVDFWSLGVLLFEMLCGWSPFYNEDTQTMYRNICYGKIKFPRNTVSEDGKQFVKGLLNRVPANRLGSKRDAAELKEHAFFKIIDWGALSHKEVTPPFKPDVESDESTANFDPEFTSADLREAGVENFDEDDPSDAWVNNGAGSTVRTYNGPVGSEKHVVPGVGAPEGAIDYVDAVQAAQGAVVSDAAVRPVSSKPPKRPSTPISRSVQDNFKGFSYNAESVDEFAGGFFAQRAREDAERERREQERAMAVAVIDEDDDDSQQEQRWDGGSVGRVQYGY